MGSFTAKEKEMDLANRKTLRMQKIKINKKSPCLFACELSSRIQFRSSLPEIFPGAEE